MNIIFNLKWQNCNTEHPHLNPMLFVLEGWYAVSGRCPCHSATSLWTANSEWVYFVYIYYLIWHSFTKFMTHPCWPANWISFFLPPTQVTCLATTLFWTRFPVSLFQYEQYQVHRVSLVEQALRGHRESRVLLADQDSLEPVGKMAVQEREVNIFTCNNNLLRH